MTFQQKILAKQSKKGFTLVELVVVIAILAILAAVAIPMVTGIINSATTSSKESDASTLNHACKTFMTSVAAGTITTETVSKAGITYSGTSLPSKSSTQSTKNSIANSLTVADACDYNGLKGIAESIADFGVLNPKTGSATIVYMASNDGAQVMTSSGPQATGTASTACKLCDIYGKVG